jgi:uncharacterized protein
MELLPLSLLLLVGIVASLYGVSVGGAGLLILPTVILIGFPPQNAIATSVLGYLGMCTVGAAVYGKAGKVDLRIGLPATFIGIIGAAVGAFIVLELPEELLRKIIGIFLLLILCVLLFKRDYGLEKRSMSTPMRILGFALFFPLGLHATLIAAGTSIVTSYVLIFLLGQTFLESAGTKKLFFLGTNITGLSIYATAGLVDWTAGLFLFVGTALGSYLGAHYALKKGDQWVKWLFVPIVVASSLKLLV